MRSRTLLLALPLTWVACFSASSSGGPGAEFDAGFEGGFDGEVADSTLPDSEQPDSPAEAQAEASPPVDSGTTPEAEASGPTPVVVIVGGAAGFETGIPVVFGDASGAVLSSGMTAGAAGAAAGVVPPTGGMITVLLGTAAMPSLYTVTGVKPGDQVLVADWTSIAPFVGESAAITSVPAATWDAGVGSYSANAGSCYNSAVALPVDVSLGGSTAGDLPCIGLTAQGASFGAAYPLLVRAYDPVGTPLGFTVQKNNLLTGADDAGLVSPMLTGTWSTSETTQTVFVTQADGGTPPSLTYTYSEIANGVPMENFLAAAAPPDAGPVPIGTAQTHVGYADSVLLEGSQASVNGFPQGNVVEVAGPPPTADGMISLDVTSIGTIPTITAVTATAPTPAQPTIGWTVSGGTLAGLTGVVAMTRWTSAADASTAQSGLWTIVTPGTSAASVQAPQLPAALASYAPSAGVTYGEVTVYAIDGQTAIPDYASLVKIGSLFRPQDGPCSLTYPALPQMPGAGTVAASIFSTGNGQGC